VMCTEDQIWSLFLLRTFAAECALVPEAHFVLYLEYVNVCV